jgi:hypothetical protein
MYRPNEEASAQVDAQKCAARGRSQQLTPTSRVRPPIVLILLILVNSKLWHCDGLEWHNIHSKFRENRASGLKSTFEEAMMYIACHTCATGCGRI